jgi:muramoyltetrapeptide carboxypeptidase
MTMTPMFRAMFRDLGLALVAPGGYAPDEAALARGIAGLEALGCRVHSYCQPSEKFQRFGATDQARIDQLHAAARDPDAQIVLSLRGGYGMSRILPALDLDLLAASIRAGKLFVGHSDFTALQLALLAHDSAGTGRAPAVTFCGPMMCADFMREPLSDFTMRHFWQCVTNDSCKITVEQAGNPELNVEGTLWGGNLAMLTHLTGTPYMPQIDGGILFVEDINEHPYRIERMLLQLLHAGVLERQKALVLGDFSGYRLTEYDNGYDFDAMLEYLRKALPIPVLTGLPFGHIVDKVTLAVGAQAALRSEAGGFELHMHGYPRLAQNHIASV